MRLISLLHDLSSLSPNFKFYRIVMAPMFEIGVTMFPERIALNFVVLCYHDRLLIYSTFD